MSTYENGIRVDEWLPCLDDHSYVKFLYTKTIFDYLNNDDDCADDTLSIEKSTDFLMIITNQINNITISKYLTQTEAVVIYSALVG